MATDRWIRVRFAMAESQALKFVQSLEKNQSVCELKTSGWKKQTRKEQLLNTLSDPKLSAEEKLKFVSEMYAIKN